MEKLTIKKNAVDFFCPRARISGTVTSRGHSTDGLIDPGTLIIGGEKNE